MSNCAQGRIKLRYQATKINARTLSCYDKLARSVNRGIALHQALYKPCWIQKGQDAKPFRVVISEEHIATPDCDSLRPRRNDFPSWKQDSARSIYNISRPFRNSCCGASNYLLTFRMPESIVTAIRRTEERGSTRVSSPRGLLLADIPRKSLFLASRFRRRIFGGLIDRREAVSRTLFVARY